MAYTDRDAVRAVLAPDGVTDGTAASLEDDDLDTIIERVDSRIDLFLRARYPVPLTDPIPEVINDIATDIAAYDATLAYYKGTDLSDQDPVIRRYRDARGMLGQIGTGLLILDVPNADTTIDDPVVVNPDPYPGSLPSPGQIVALVVREIPPGRFY
jgi:phage gp36-like protein